MKQILEQKFCFPSTYEKEKGIECRLIDKEYLSQFGTEGSVSLESIVPEQVRKIVLNQCAYVGLDFPNGESGLLNVSQNKNKSLSVPSGTTISIHQNRVVGLPIVSGG